MFESGQGVLLRHEPRAVGRVRGMVRADDLERDFPIRFGLAGAVDRRHAALADAAHDREPGDDRPGRQLRRRVELGNGRRPRVRCGWCGRRGRRRRGRLALAARLRLGGGLLDQFGRHVLGRLEEGVDATQDGNRRGRRSAAGTRRSAGRATAGTRASPRGRPARSGWAGWGSRVFPRGRPRGIRDPSGSPGPRRGRSSPGWFRWRGGSATSRYRCRSRRPAPSSSRGRPLPGQSATRARPPRRRSYG